MRATFVRLGLLAGADYLARQSSCSSLQHCRGKFGPIVPFGYNAHQQRLRSNLSGLEQSLGVKPVMYGQSAAAAAAAAAAHGVRFTEAPNNITPAQARGLALAVADRPQDRSPSNARPTPHPRTPDYGTGMLQQQLQEVRGALEAERTITSRLTARLAARLTAWRPRRPAASSCAPASAKPPGWHARRCQPSCKNKNKNKNKAATRGNTWPSARPPLRSPPATTAPCGKCSPLAYNEHPCLEMKRLPLPIRIFGVLQKPTILPNVVPPPPPPLQCQWPISRGMQCPAGLFPPAD